MVDGYAGAFQIESTVLRDLRRAVTRMYPKHTRKRSSPLLEIARRFGFEYFLVGFVLWKRYCEANVSDFMNKIVWLYIRFYE